MSANIISNRAWILWFSNVLTSRACERHLLLQGVPPTRIKVVPIKGAGRRDLSRLSEAYDAVKGEGEVLILTEVGPDRDSHCAKGMNTADPVYFLQAFEHGHFVCLVPDDPKWYSRMAEEGTQANAWKERRLSIPVSLRCTSRCTPIFFDGSTGGITDIFTKLEAAPLAAACKFTCVSSTDPPLSEVDYSNWDVLLFDDQVLGATVIGAAGDLPQAQFKDGLEAKALISAVECLVTKLRGNWFLGGTEAACSLICRDKEYKNGDIGCTNDAHSEIPRLRDPNYGFDNYDVILLDVLFDLKMAADILFVPPLLRRTSSPVFMFSSAGIYSTHGESALYYANRALRLGAHGYIEKTGIASGGDEADKAVRTIRTTYDHHQWSREWSERFERGADQFLGGKDGKLVRELEIIVNEALEAGQSSSVLRPGQVSGDATSLKKFKYILCKLFEGADRVQFEREAPAGVGAGTKFFVTAERNGRWDNSKLVKLGLYEDLRFEAENYSRCIDGYVDTFIGQVSREPVRAGRYMGVAYDCVGYAKDEYGDSPRLSTLSEMIYESCLRSIGPREVKEQLADIDGATLSRLYRERGKLSNALLHSVKTGLPRTSYETVTAEHLKEECGVNDVAQWWRREYCTVLPAVTEFTSLLPCKIEGLPPTDRKAQAEPNRIRGRVWKWSKTREDGAGELQYSFDLLDPLNHKRWRVSFPAREDHCDELNFRFGKWIQITSARNFGRRRLTDSLRWQFEKARRCETDGGILSPLYEKILDGPFELARVVVGRAPFDVFDSLLDNMGWGDRDAGKPSLGLREPMTLSTIHGDLNLGNLLIGESPGPSKHYNYWLIDFEATRLRGHLALDFAKLEVETRSEVISRLLLNNALVWMHDRGRTGRQEAAQARERAIMLLHTLESALEAGQPMTGIPTTFATAYTWLSEIRKLAKRYDVGDDELRISTFLYTIRSIGFYKKSKQLAQSPTIPFPKVVQYIAASIMAPSVVRILASQ